MKEIFSSQVFGIMLTIFVYILGDFIYRRTKFPLFSPLLLASTILIIFILITDIRIDSSLSALNSNIFLGPLIVSLAVPVAQKIDLIKKYFPQIMIGSIIGALISVFSMMILGNIFNLDKEIIASLLPRSTTSPIAIEIAKSLGGIEAIAAAVVIISAVIGAIILPIIIKTMNIKNPLIIGMGLGITSTAIGTAKAFEIDKEAGAIAGVTLVISGVLTVIITLFI